MKKFNFLSKLCSSSRTDRVRTLAIDAVSLPSFCRVNMLKLVSILIILLTIGSGNAWGAEETITFSSSTSTTSGSGTTFTITWTNGTSCTINQSKGNSNTNVANYTTAPRWYQNHLITFTPRSGYTISKVIITASSSNNGQTMTFNSGAGSIANTSSTVTTVTGSWSSAFTLKMGTQCRPSTVKITYTASCTKIDAPTVTATPGDGRIDLSWSNQTGASSYSVTKTPAGGTVGTPSKSGSTWSCAITGLTNGTTYTWSVEAVGSGDYCASGNTAASASATPNVFRTITYYDKDGQHTTSLADGTNIATALTALYGGDDPVSCDATNYEYFVGWKVGEISGTASSVTLLDDEVVNSSSPSNNYYAVWSDTDPSSGSWEVATSISAGDVVVLCNQACTYELNGISTTSTTYGIIASVTEETPANLYPLTIEAGASDGTFSFKNGTNYLCWSTGNSLTSSTTKNNNSSWTVSISAGVATIRNKNDNTRYLQYNAGSRFACYTNTQADVALYKQTSSGTPVYITTCCTELGSINGSVSLSQLATPDPTKLKATWSMNATTGIASYDLEVYNSSNVKVKTINNYTSGDEITGLDPCTTYYVKLYTVSSGSPYCDGGLIGTSSTCTTNGYTLTVTKSNVSLSSGSEPTNICSNVSATYEASDGYNLPSTITVTNAGAENTGWTWNSSTGALTINKANVTGNVTVTITGTAQSNFINGETVFIQADSKDYSAWKDDACVKAWFNASGAGGAAQTTYWLFDATDTDAGKKLFAAIVPSTGDLNQVTLQRFQSDCLAEHWYNNNGTLTKASSGGVNTFRSYGSADNNVAWNGSSTILYLYGSQNSWESSLGTFADQGAGVWTATISNYAPDATSEDYKIKTSYNNGWIGNTGSNNNATLSDMIVGSTYNVTATLNVTDHSLVMSKTFVKGEVSFDLQGHGSAISKLTNVAAGSKISAPSPAPSATGWDFGGWFKEPACTNEWNFASDEVDETMTLYAKWTKKSYTITSTLNNVTSSPAIPSSYEYTGSAASLSYTITPSSGYRLPTSITVSGTTYTWNSATGALTLTGTITSNVSITITAVQTHTVDWYVGGSAVGNKLGDDGQTTVVDHGGKIEDFPATTPDGSACDKTFVGWTNTSSYVHGTSPLFNDVAGSPTINADASFYAVFATESGSATTYTLVSDAASFTDGTYVVAALSSSTYYFMDGNGTADGLGVETTGLSSSSVSEGSFTASNLPTGAIEIEVVDDEEPDGDDHYYFISYSDATNTYYMDDEGTKQSLNWTTNTTVYTYHPNFTQNAGTDGCVLLSGSGAKVSQNGSNKASFIRNYASSGSFYNDIYFFKKSGGITYTDYTIVCGSCSNEVTVAYTAAPTGGTVAVTKGGAAVAAGSTVKTCTGGASLVVTVTPSTHYSVSGVTFTPSAGLVAGDLSGTSTPASTTAGVWTYNVTIAEDAAGTLTIAPTLVEEAHIAITWNVNGVALSPSPAEGLTWVYSGGDLTALPSEPSVPAGCTGTKVFAGWSAKHSDATEEDASYYDDLFTAVGDAPTGISSEKTFYAVFATSSSNPLAGTVMWDEPFDGDAGDQPSSPTSGATVYGSASISYNCASTTYCKLYTDNLASGGAASPELLIPKSSRGEAFEITGIPTAGQTELTLTYMAKDALSVTTGTSGVTIGDASVDNKLYTRTITIDQSGLGVASFGLTFAKSTDSNSRLDDIHLIVPGSSTLTDYVTLCAPSYTITYNKNTEDAVTNLPSPTSVLQSTGSGTLSSTVPERATYTFSGWAETTSGAVAYAAGGSITGVTGDKTLYAVWVKTPVEELTLNYSELNKYVGDPAVTLEVTGVTPEGADATVTWSSNNSTVASVVAATGVVTFGTVGTATITATSSVTGTTTAYCYVTVRNKPTATFVDLIHDGNGTDLSTYHMQNVAGTAIVFPTLDDYATPGDDCDTKHYIFVGWTTRDNNDDPEDYLVTSDELEDDQDKVFYAVWADGVEGVSYTQLTTSTFKTSPTKYVIGAIDGDDTFYFYSCDATDANNGNGGCTNAPGTNAPIQFTLSGTANALVATSTEATARYLTPLTAKNFQMSATSKTIQLNAVGTIANPSDDSWTLRFNTSEDYLRWYSSATGNAAYFYEVTAGAAVSYRTSCCTNNVPAPTVIATNTAYTVTLTWAAVDGATGYEVSWNGGAFTAATSPCVKSDLTASTDYTYKVRATYDPLVKCGALVASGSVTTDDVYSVTYSGGTGTGSCSPSGSVAPASYEAGATVTLAPTNSFSLTSNTFAAWVVKDADDNDVPVSNNQFTMPAKNVTVTATWTAVQDKYYDRMHDGTDALHGGFADGEGKYYLVLEGCNYTVPTLTDDDDGDTDCHTTHYKLLGWIAQSHLKTDGSGEIKTDEESYIFQGGGTKSATGATYYAVWAIMTE